MRVPAQDGTPVSFLIRPTTLGNIDLRMTAKAATAGDAIVKKLLVKVLLTPMFSFSNIFNNVLVLNATFQLIKDLIHILIWLFFHFEFRTTNF